MCLSLLYPLGMLLKGLVEEKETGTRELMRISGLQSWALGAAWALTYVVLFVAVATAAAIVLGGSVFPHCDVIVIWGLLFVFMLSIIPLGFVISTFFNRARLASIFGPFALFGLVLPRYIFFRTTQGQALAGKRAACLLSPTAFTFAADSFGRFEAGNAGVTLDNLWEGELSVGECMAWLLLDTFLYSLLAFYLDKATITATLTAWARAALARWRGQAAMPPRSLFDVEAGAAATDVEAAHAGAPVVLMRGLTKVYDNGVRAVSGLDLTLYDGEITCLLGHNGAGKSTAISLLTGLVAPTAGAITVCGLDVRSDMRDVRGLLGVCPQQNVLFPLLTVAEHLRLFAVLKAVPGDQVTRAVGELMHEVGLEDKAHAAAAALSGGMKRRLQLACALVGGSRVIVLDEPTSGMDPVSRCVSCDCLSGVVAKPTDDVAFSLAGATPGTCCAASAPSAAFWCGAAPLNACRSIIARARTLTRLSRSPCSSRRITWMKRTCWQTAWPSCRRGGCGLRDRRSSSSSASAAATR
jgi:ABC-type Na+ transport system ATPase subunit NatA